MYQIRNNRKKQEVEKEVAKRNKNPIPAVNQCIIVFDCLYVTVFSTVTHTNSCFDYGLYDLYNQN